MQDRTSEKAKSFLIVIKELVNSTSSSTSRVTVGQQTLPQVHASLLVLWKIDKFG